MLLVERSSHRVARSPEWLSGVDCFRLSLLPGNSEVIATKVSSFDTFGFDYADFSKKTISDHSGKYYAAYSSAGVSPSGCAVQVWDIESGKIVRRIPAQGFPGILDVTNVLVIAKQGPDGPQQVVVAGNEGTQNPRPCWIRVPGEWGYVTEFKVFPIEAGSSEWTGCIAKHENQRGIPWSPTLELSPLASAFKVPRCPAGLNFPDTPNTPGYLGEEMGLTLWNSGTGNACSFYHRIVPDHLPVIAPGVPIAVERELRMPFGGASRLSPFTVGPRSGLSLNMDFTGRREYIEGRPLIQYQLCIRSFYPSATPGVMNLEWETCLKSSKDARSTRMLYSLNRNVDNFNTFPLIVVNEDEPATAFLEWNSGGMDLVIILWGEGFKGELPLGGKVLNRGKAS